MWIFALVAIIGLAVGGGLLYHSIGAKAVAEHELQVQHEQDKLDAVAKAKTEAAGKALAANQVAYEKGKAERQIVERKIYLKGEEVVKYLPAAARSVDCVIPPAGMAVLNSARAAAMGVLGITEQDVSIRETDPRVPPEQATKPQPSGRPSKPTPVGPK